MNEELQETTENCVGVPFKEGFDERRNYDGRPKDTPEKKLEKKAIKEIVKEYKEALADMLPEIQPIIRTKALEGDMSAIKEIHDRVMDKSKQPTDVTSNGESINPILVKFIDDKQNTDNRDSS